MIFVTVGTSSWDFSRLLIEMDAMAPELDEEIIMQIGYSVYIPSNTKYFRVASSSKINSLYSNSRLVISHAGIGCILSALKFKKPLIIVPRRKAFNEHFDDHQVEIAQALQTHQRITVVWDIGALKSAVLNQINLQPTTKSDDSLVMRLRRYIDSL
ncbi:MAG: PssE/Cps14G family polysaccharide biosynthesis glycosyltransferase [Candidatus Methanosuratincola petrocarbonis]